MVILDRTRQIDGYDILEPYSGVTDRHAVVHVPFEVDRGRLGGLRKEGWCVTRFVLLVRCHVRELGSAGVCRSLSLSLSLSVCVCVHACARVCRFAGKIVGRSIAILRCVFLRGICVCLPSDHSTKEERTCGVAARAALNGLKLTAGATRVGNFLRVR